MDLRGHMMWRAKLGSLGAAVALVCVLGYVDLITGYEINLGLFYVIPVALATWTTGLVPGVSLSVVSVIGMFIVDNFDTRDIPFPSNDLIPYWNMVIRLGYFLVITTILAALKRAHDRERRHARQDFLTGVANSQTFAELARMEIARARRRPQPLTIAYLDCDDFKQINDRLGHQAGDELLKVVATTLGEKLRESDLVARVGGDEFAVLLIGASPPLAVETLERLRAELVGRMQQHGWPVTFSMGAVTFVTAPQTLEMAMNSSDMVMYAAKRSGKNTLQHRIHDPAGLLERR